MPEQDSDDASHTSSTVILETSDEEDEDDDTEEESDLNLSQFQSLVTHSVQIYWLYQYQKTVPCHKDENVPRSNHQIQLIQKLSPLNAKGMGHENHWLC
jgi:hypothetical protein